MPKTTYIGDELRIDGYYYSNLTSNNDIGVAVFYNDGFCFHTWITPKSQDTLNYIENVFLLNDEYISKLKTDPFHIGVFRIINPNIEIEIWAYRSWIFSYFGEVINDTAFTINKSKDHNSNKTYPENLIYRFKPFSPKPDSTNVFIK